MSTNPGMTASRIAPLLAVATLACQPAPDPPAVTPATLPTAAAVMRRFDRVATLDLWPGFRPESIPVALFDGERTWLFRHPSPPGGYEPVPGESGVHMRPGRDSLVWANSSVMMNGVRTATVMPPPADATPTSQAAVVVHEVFHVFQRARHPGWSANEGELFTYPVTDPELLALRRLESEALRRALAARTDAETACWARAAMGIRSRRFAALPAGARGYERGSEWNEGLATYVQARAGGKVTPITPAEFPAEDVRQRFYAVGPAIGVVLDRLDPAWRSTLERADTVALDALLADAAASADTTRCGITATERALIERRARDDVSALQARLAAEREALLRRPGWTVVIVAGGAPLWPQGFDPLNVRMVAPGEVLHRRMLQLGNADGALEVLDHAVLTSAAGAHPLFSGVRRATVTGLVADPVQVADSVVQVTAPGLRAAFRGATVIRRDPVVEVHLRP